MINNLLEKKDTPQDESFIQQLPIITHLNWSKKLKDKTRAELTKMFVAIDVNVLSVDLSNNEFSGFYYRENVFRNATFEAIPGNVRSIDLSFNDCPAEQIATIPLSITSLALRYNQTHLSFFEILVVLPLGVVHLDFSHNDFRSGWYKTYEEIVAINTSLKSLNLSHCVLGEIAHSVLIQVLKWIPLSVSDLHLSENYLNKKTGPELVQVFSAIPGGVVTLNLSGNYFNKKTGAELAPAIKAIPSNVTTLDLSDNYLGHQKVTEVVEVLAAIPPRITSLNLSNNDFHKKTPIELAQIIAAIPSTVKYLNLSNNDLGYYRAGTQLTQIFRAISSGVMVLDLSCNYFKVPEATELSQGFKAIPPTVMMLDLSDNYFNEKTPTELAQIFSGIPEGITVTLCKNQLFTSKSCKERDKLLTALTVCNPSIYINLAENGESDAQRAVGSLVSIEKQKIFPGELTEHILSYLLPKTTSLVNIQSAFFTTRKMLNSKYIPALEPHVIKEMSDGIEQNPQTTIKGNC